MAKLEEKGKLLVVADTAGRIAGAMMVSDDNEINAVLEAKEGQRLHFVKLPDNIAGLDRPELLPALLTGACITEKGALVMRKVEMRD